MESVIISSTFLPKYYSQSNQNVVMKKRSSHDQAKTTMIIQINNSYKEFHEHLQKISRMIKAININNKMKKPPLDHDQPPSTKTVRKPSPITALFKSVDDFLYIRLLDLPLRPIIDPKQVLYSR